MTKPIVSHPVSKYQETKPAKNRIDLSGKRFSRLTVTDKTKTIGKTLWWLCVCDCGTEKYIRAQSLSKGSAISCGCYVKEYFNKTSKTHGMSRTKTYRCWLHLRARCNYPKDIMYKRYGGRGISVCERWNKFENFLEDMGEVPEGKEIDRIDFNGNYEPSNCRWVTRIEQARNKCDTILISHNGETKTIIEWAEETGIKYATIYKRIVILKWDAELALYKKPMKFENKIFMFAPKPKKNGGGWEVKEI